LEQRRDLAGQLKLFKELTITTSSSISSVEHIVVDVWKAWQATTEDQVFIIIHLICTNSSTPTPLTLRLPPHLHPKMSTDVTQQQVQQAQQGGLILQELRPP